MLSRVFHFLWLYLVVFLLYIVCYQLIVRPILILINAAFYLVILLTAWIWVPILLLLHYLFTLLVYNLDHDY